MTEEQDEALIDVNLFPSRRKGKPDFEIALSTRSPRAKARKSRIEKRSKKDKAVIDMTGERDNLSLDVRKVDIRDCILQSPDMTGLSATKQAGVLFECLVDKRRLGKPIVMAVDITDARRRFERFVDGIAARDPSFTPEDVARSLGAKRFAESLGFSVEELIS